MGLVRMHTLILTLIEGSNKTFVFMQHRLYEWYMISTVRKRNIPWGLSGF